MDTTYDEYKQYMADNELEFDKDFPKIYQGVLGKHAELTVYESQLVIIRANTNASNSDLSPYILI